MVSENKIPVLSGESSKNKRKKSPGRPVSLAPPMGGEGVREGKIDLSIFL
jgi:hypothetical protein